jgi:LPXTG-motif cell wall-anchored protein
MKKSVFVFLIAFLLIFSGISLVNAQDQPAPKKDTVNIDTDARPEVYYDIEDEESMDDQKSGNTTVIIIVGAVVVIGGLAVMLLKKKK